MKRAHHLSDSLFDAIYQAVTTRHHWIAYRSDLPYLQQGNLYCFREVDEALAFKAAAASKGHAYALIYAPSVLTVYRQIERVDALSVRSDFSNLKKSTMNEQNFDYLKDSLKYLGFGEGLAEKLKEQLSKGEPAFQLTFETEMARKAFAAVINFRKSDATDKYFVNSYHATLGRKDGEVTDQVFYLNKGKGVTAKEAYNLLDGRSVYKELANKDGEHYHAWIKLDFEKRDKHNNHEVRQFHEAYGYDLKEALSRFAFSELKDPEKSAALLASLQKGNLQAVTFEGEGSVAKLFVEANPQYKSVTLYDGALQRMPKEALEQFKAPAAGKEITQEMHVKKELGGKEVASKGGKEVTLPPSPEGDGTLAKKGKDVNDLLPKKDGETKKSLKIG